LVNDNNSALAWAEEDMASGISPIDLLCLFLAALASAARVFYKSNTSLAQRWVKSIV
jgi:hypothetical protein